MVNKPSSKRNIYTCVPLESLTDAVVGQGNNAEFPNDSVIPYMMATSLMVRKIYAHFGKNIGHWQVAPVLFAFVCMMEPLVSSRNCFLEHAIARQLSYDPAIHTSGGDKHWNCLPYFQEDQSLKGKPLT